MKSSRGSVVFLAGALISIAACSSSRLDSPEASAGSAGAGPSAGAAGASGNNAGGSSAVGGAGSGGSLPACGTAGSTAGTGGEDGEDPITIPSRADGFTGSVAALEDTNLDGQILTIEADRLEIGGDGETWTFWWTGLALDDAFAVGDPVRFGLWSIGFQTPAAQNISIVRSATVTAAAIDAGAVRTFLDTSPGSTEALPDRPGFPELIYHLVSCCISGSPPTTVCDYSGLEARFEGDSAFIDLARIGTVGPWTVTNLGSEWSRSTEAVWRFRATLLGPATPEETPP